jgi:hypothetical protein
VTITARSQHPDHALRENAQQRVHKGTHLAPDAADDALFVECGTGTLGDNQGALNVRPGTALVGGTEHTIESETPVDIASGDGNPRRDVVYLDSTGALAVGMGTPHPFAWDDALAKDERTTTNAYRPAPPDLASVAGLPLATVTVTTNAGTLPTGAITELRAKAPAVTSGTVDGQPIQAALDGHVVAVAPEHGVTDAIDPTASQTPVGDAYALARDAGGGQVILPPEPVENAARINVDTNIPVGILGTAYRRSEIEFTDTTDHAFDITSRSAGPAKGTFWHNFRISGSDASARPKGATSALNFHTGGKDFNIGALAFREWNGNVIKGGVPYGSTWNHLAFGYGESNNNGTLLRLTGQGAPLQINQFHAATSTTDPLIATDQPRHVYLDIGTMNIGGEHGSIIDITGGSYSIVDIDLVNFEPVGSGTATHAIRFDGGVKGRIGPFLSKTGTIDDVFVLGNGHESVIGPVVIGPNQTVNNAIVRLAEASDDTSYYYGPANDVDYGGQNRDELVALAEPYKTPQPTTRTSANYTSGYGEIVLCDTSANSVTVTLPSAEQGARVTAENILSNSGNEMVIETPGSGTIDGGDTIARATEGTGYELVCDGTDWWTV